MAERITTAGPRMWRGWPLVLAVLCGVLAYSNSFRGPFIWDDIDSILRNPRINKGLVDSGRDVPTTLSGRPVLRTSFEIDYLIGGMNVGVYHATNLVIHLACGIVLFGVVRRTLVGVETPTLALPLSTRGGDKKGGQGGENWHGRFEHSGHWLAGAVAAIWLVHPLNTEAVTYIVQRAESLAGLFYLLVIYCLIRDWKVVAVIFCALGMGTKETVVTAPIVALLFDRTFISGSFGGALKARRGLYFGLAATWVILFFAIGARSKSVGNILPVDYAVTQLGVIAHYLQLAFWPGGLVLDYYDWPIAHGVGIGGAIVLGMIAFTLVALFAKPWLGFLGAWFFLVLAPSSSVVPVFTEIAAEHRMYLPLMAIVVLVVVGGWVLVSGPHAVVSCPHPGPPPEYQGRGKEWIGSWVAGLLFMCALTGLSARTFLRNAEYENPEVIWADAVSARPGNPRAHFNLGYSQMVAGKPAQAAAEFRRALELEPDYYMAAVQLRRALRQSAEQPDGDVR